METQVTSSSPPVARTRGGRVRRLIRVIDVSERAAALLVKAGAAARRFNPDACIRVVPTDGGVRFVLSDGPEDGDVSVERDGVTFFADPTLAGTVDVEDPHDRLVLRSNTPRG